MKILFRSPLTTNTGYGNDGIGMAMALLKRGVDLRLMPTHITPPLPGELADRMKVPVEAPFDMYLNHSDPGRFDVGYAAQNSSDLCVGWTMWEYTTLQNMDRDGRIRLAASMPELDVFVSYDHVTYQAFEHFLDRLQELPESHRYHMDPDDRPLNIIAQGGYTPGDWVPPTAEQDKRSWQEGQPFRFCMVGQLHIRKDPMVAVMAFKELKEEMGSEFEDAELHLKTNIPGLHPLMENWVPKLRVHYASWPQEVLKEFYYSCNVLLAPSRGEGKNMPALEMLSTGGTVIATNWGGHTTWMSSEYAYPLDYTLASEPPFEDCQSARASKEHLKELMWHTYTHRTEAKVKGEIAAKTLPVMQNWDATVDNMLRVLADNHPTYGERLKALLALAGR